MGCCCAPMTHPDDPSILAFSPVTQVIVKKADSILTYKYGKGTAFVKGDMFHFRANCRGQLNFFVKDIKEVSLVRVFRDKGVYFQPCYCCTCTGCPDGIVDIRGTLNDVDFHIGLAVPDAEEFVDQLQAQLVKKDEF